MLKRDQSVLRNRYFGQIWHFNLKFVVFFKVNGAKFGENKKGRNSMMGMQN